MERLLYEIIILPIILFVAISLAWLVIAFLHTIVIATLSCFMKNTRGYNSSKNRRWQRFVYNLVSISNLSTSFLFAGIITALLIYNIYKIISTFFILVLSLGGLIEITEFQNDFISMFVLLIISPALLTLLLKFALRQSYKDKSGIKKVEITILSKFLYFIKKYVPIKESILLVFTAIQIFNMYTGRTDQVAVQAFIAFLALDRVVAAIYKKYKSCITKIDNKIFYTDKVNEIANSNNELSLFFVIKNIFAMTKHYAKTGKFEPNESLMKVVEKTDS